MCVIIFKKWWDIVLYHPCPACFKFSSMNILVQLLNEIYFWCLISRRYFRLYTTQWFHSYATYFFDVLKKKFRNISILLHKPISKAITNSHIITHNKNNINQRALMYSSAWIVCKRIICRKPFVNIKRYATCRARFSNLLWQGVTP